MITTLYPPATLFAGRPVRLVAPPPAQASFRELAAISAMTGLLIRSSMIDPTPGQCWEFAAQLEAAAPAEGGAR